jgi:hypothetical protein
MIEAFSLKDLVGELQLVEDRESRSRHFVSIFGQTNHREPLG